LVAAASVIIFFLGRGLWKLCGGLGQGVASVPVMMIIFTVRRVRVAAMGLASAGSVLG
jgi:hypothetical protein